MLVTMKAILLHAKENNYGVTAPNIQNEDMARAVVREEEKCNAPMIIDINSWVHPDIPWLVNFCRDLAIRSTVPIAINLDHGKNYHDMILGIRSGFTSIMVDRSSLPYEENVAQTKEVVKMCHELNISVEAELGHVGQGEQYDTDGISNLTVPEEASQFIKETGVDCLAVAIGTAHGVYKGIPKLDVDRLSQIREVVSIPLVLHGTSGVPDDAVRECIRRGICKVNYATDLRIAFSNGVKEYLAENPDVFDPKKYCAVGREKVKEYVMSKMLVCGSNGRA